MKFDYILVLGLSGLKECENGSRYRSGRNKPSVNAIAVLSVVSVIL
jgi:hypothetical protein